MKANALHLSRLYSVTKAGLALIGLVTVFGLTVVNNLFDFNADGTVDGTDFAEFGARFGLTL